MSENDVYRTGWDSSVAALIWKTLISTAVLIILFLWLNSQLGYERTELMAFALFIGLTIASMKPKN